MSVFTVYVNGASMGSYEATDAETAITACAIAFKKDRKTMVRQNDVTAIERRGRLVARRKGWSPELVGA